MFKKIFIVFVLVCISLLCAKDKVLTLACLPPEGSMDEDSKASYITAVESAFTKAGHRVADRQRLDKLMKEILLQKSGVVDETEIAAEAGKIMKVDYLVAVTVDKWEEEKVSSAAGARAAGSVLGALLGSSQTTVTSGDTDLITVENSRLTVKVIELETGYIIASGVAQGKRSEDPSKLAVKIVKDITKQLKNKK